jgi:hypothetical protein
VVEQVGERRLETQSQSLTYGHCLRQSRVDRNGSGPL